MRLMRRLGRCLWVALGWVGLLVSIVTWTPVTYWWASWLAGPWTDPAGDILIVPGAAMEPDGLPGLQTHRRSVYAALVWRQGGFGKILLCGAGTGPAMRNYLAAAGVPAEAILVEARSTSTRENAVEAARLLAAERGSKVLLTSDLHVYRASRAFRRAGIAVLPRPIPHVRKQWYTPAQRWASFLELAEESGKIGYYWFKGWI